MFRALIAWWREDRLKVCACDHVRPGTPGEPWACPRCGASHNTGRWVRRSQLDKHLGRNV